MERELEVLVLDDEPIVGKRLQPSLAKVGCRVEVFEDPRAALARIAEKEFDIVVTDVRMDEVDGLQVLEAVAARSPRTKVIMITGYAMMSLARQAMDKGAFDFIAKPFTPEALRAVVQKAAQALAAEGSGGGAGLAQGL
jgi:DNA-binding NtrC family response regulator